MKRILSACLCQLIHFSVKVNVSAEEQHRMVAEEYEKYRHSLERSRTKYKILQELYQEDGSLMIEIRREYALSPVGNYLD